jgi:hypothetical protein
LAIKSDDGRGKEGGEKNDFHGDQMCSNVRFALKFRGGENWTRDAFTE